jgi:hypothetical protein
MQSGQAAERLFTAESAEDAELGAANRIGAVGATFSSFRFPMAGISARRSARRHV